MIMKKTLFSAVAIAALFMMNSCAEPQYEKPTEASQKGFALSFFKNVVSTSDSGENIVLVSRFRW